MSSSIPGLVLCYHGCDRSIAEKVLTGKDTLSLSTNPYDWLGHGIYFWENSYFRALDYAETIKRHPERVKNPIKNPAVIGAVIDLGNCLNLLDSEYIRLVKQGHELLVKTLENTDVPIPVNERQEDGVPMLRHLDCAVIEAVHFSRREEQEIEFDTVRAMFTEGKKLYDGAGFQEKNHIQICVRNPNCIKGYFRVPDPVKGYSIP